MFGRVEDEWRVNDEILYTIGEHLAMLSEPRKRIALRIAAELQLSKCSGLYTAV